MEPAPGELYYSTIRFLLSPRDTCVSFKRESISRLESRHRILLVLFITGGGVQGSSEYVEDLHGSGLRGVEIVLAARI